MDELQKLLDGAIKRQENIMNEEAKKFSDAECLMLIAAFEKSVEFLKKELEFRKLKSNI